MKYDSHNLYPSIIMDCCVFRLLDRLAIFGLLSIVPETRFSRDLDGGSTVVRPILPRFRRWWVAPKPRRSAHLTLYLCLPRSHMNQSRYRCTKDALIVSSPLSLSGEGVRPVVITHRWSNTILGYFCSVDFPVKEADIIINIILRAVPYGTEYFYERFHCAPMIMLVLQGHGDDI